MTTEMAGPEAPTGDPWHGEPATEVAQAFGVDPEEGLSTAEAAERLDRHGPNAIPAEPPPSYWEIAREALSDPMNLMLLAVTVAALLIGQVSTGILVGVLVVLNVVMATNQELKAKATVAALEDLQVPTARVRRDGRVSEIAATDLVPGDVITVEAGDLVPADGRIVSSASLEVQEAALTGESAPVAKDPAAVADDAALGDRSGMAFQNTAVSRGTATVVVTGTGGDTEMGKIAGMLRGVERARS
ncbi:MAG: HAD-IC family P-type ATPase, partial [Actinomycetota bacterium]